MLGDPFGEEIFHNIPSKPPLAQFQAISSCPIACYLGKETNLHLSTTSSQVVVESYKVSPQPPFLQAKQTPVPSAAPHKVCALDPSPALLLSFGHAAAPQYLLVVRGSELNIIIEVWPHQCWVQGDNHYPSPAGHTISDTNQHAIGLLGHLGTLLARIKLTVDQHPQVLFHRAAFQPLFPKPVALHGVVVTQVQDPALGLVEPHTIGFGPSIQSVQIPL
ncbi:hypothetical protein llap_11996 [Limosa lapponica baueri]|uniref:Uncharacterized protein n=1 Tax=Limosa lapponica baueri TaxID=1758121 RepID=A0A2I0TV50_LIMLA|nr:hypothetical protein llap_11996 [Limosa lapponica baueri]